MIAQSNKSSQINEKSIPLSPKDVSKIKNYTKKFDYRYQAADEIGISRGTLQRVLVFGSCNSETYKKLQDKGILQNIAA